MNGYRAFFRGNDKMAEKLYIGIDNGTSGTIGAVCGEKSFFIPTPAKKEQSYTKAKNMISRVDAVTLEDWIVSVMDACGVAPSSVMVVMERPMVNPSMFKTTMSAIRALEATLVTLEKLRLPRKYIDSKEWQKDMLPKGTVGTTELKKASMDIGRRLYPCFDNLIVKHKDADGLLIAHWAKMCRF